MSQNRSSAVMAQRHEAHDSLEFFPTPPWAARALVEHVLIGHGWRRDTLARHLAWEPACGQGHMTRPLAEYFREAIGTDVHGYGAGTLHDFLMPAVPPLITSMGGADWAITNPPFRLAAEFVLRGKDVAREGVAMLVRTAFLESGGRYRNLFEPYPPLIVAPFVERVILSKGRLLDPSKLYWDEDAQKWKRPSTATSYAWIVWPGRTFVRTQRDTRLIWIPPCRKALERPGDYDDAPEAA